MMSTEIAVLRALLQMSRRRAFSAGVTLTDLVAIVSRTTRRRDAAHPSASPEDVQRAIGSLARAQLVQRTGEHARLSLAGLAVAVAAASYVQSSSRAKTVAQPRVVRLAPTLRRAARGSRAA